MTDAWWVGPEQLNDEQRAVISLPLEGSHLILGPPGSGKTNLLLLRANYMTLAGHPNIVVIVFTRTLQEFIATGGHQYDFPVNKVVTARKWGQDLLYQYGVRRAWPEDFEEQRAALIEEIRQLIDKKKLGGLYDAILLDESQDYLPEEIRIFRRLGGVLFAVADFRQKIYRGEDSLETLEANVDRTHHLRFHYRNGRRICQLADALASDKLNYDPLLPTSNYDESAKPSSVEWLRCSDIDEATRRIIEKLALQLKAYPGELLGVICPLNEQLLRIWEHIDASPIGPVSVLQISGGHVPFELGKQVCLCTLHAAKGLEFRALHVAGCEGLKRFQHQRNMAYTAVTRAKSSLSLYHSADIRVT